METLVFLSHTRHASGSLEAMVAMEGARCNALRTRFSLALEQLISRLAGHDLSGAQNEGKSTGWTVVLYEQNSWNCCWAGQEWKRNVRMKLDSVASCLRLKLK